MTAICGLVPLNIQSYLAGIHSRNQNEFPLVQREVSPHGPTCGTVASTVRALSHRHVLFQGSHNYFDYFARSWEKVPISGFRGLYSLGRLCIHINIYIISQTFKCKLNFFFLPTTLNKGT